MKPRDVFVGLLLFGIISIFVAFCMFVIWLVIVPKNSLSLTNDEIISEVKKCNDAGLVGQVIFDKSKQNVVRVQCITQIKESVAGPVKSSEA